METFFAIAISSIYLDVWVKIKAHVLLQRDFPQPLITIEMSIPEPY